MEWQAQTKGPTAAANWAFSYWLRSDLSQMVLMLCKFWPVMTYFSFLGKRNIYGCGKNFLQAKAALIILLNLPIIRCLLSKKKA